MRNTLLFAFSISSLILTEISIILFPIIVWFCCKFLLLKQYLLPDIVWQYFLEILWYENNSILNIEIIDDTPMTVLEIFFQYFVVISFSCQLFFFSPNLLHNVFPEILKEPFSSILKLLKLFGINLMKEQVNS